MFLRSFIWYFKNAWQIVGTSILEKYKVEESTVDNLPLSAMKSNLYGMHLREFKYD